MINFENRQYYRRLAKIGKLKRRVAFARKRIRQFRMLIRVCMIFGIIAVCYYALNLRSWYLNPNDIVNLNPNVVKIEGNVITPTQKISDLIRTVEIPHEQIFKLSTKELENNISELQSVKKAYIRRFFFPARIIVFVDEVTPVFVIAPNENSMPISAITKEGKFVGREYMPIPTKYKTVKILSYGNEDNYEKWDKKRIDEILKFIKTVEVYSKQKVLYLDFRDMNDIYVQLDKHLLRLGRFDETIKDRIKWIPTILPQTQDLTKKVKYIDLRWSNAYFIKLEDEKAPVVKEEENQEQ